MTEPQRSEETQRLLDELAEKVEALRVDVHESFTATMYAAFGEPTLDLATRDGRENRTRIHDRVSGMLQGITALYCLGARAQADHDITDAVVRQYLADTTQTLAADMERAGFPTGDITAHLDRLGLTPPPPP